MSSPNTYLGVPVSFGVEIAGVITITGTAIGALVLQGYDYKNSRDKETIRDGVGTETQATLYNPTNEATFEYVISAANLAGVPAAVVIPDIGAIVTVAGSVQHTAINATTWFVWDDPIITAANTTAKKVKLMLKKWNGAGGIAAVTS